MALSENIPTREEYLNAKQIISAYEKEQERLDEMNDEEYEDFEYREPDYYTCMCCGNVQAENRSCGRCAGPVTDSWY